MSDFAVIRGRETGGSMGHSVIENCRFYVKNDEKNPQLFYFDASGAVVTLNGYLICPIEMFAPRQVKTAWKKYHVPR